MDKKSLIIYSSLSFLFSALLIGLCIFTIIMSITFFFYSDGGWIGGYSPSIGYMSFSVFITILSLLVFYFSYVPLCRNEKINKNILLISSFLSASIVGILMVDNMMIMFKSQFITLCIVIGLVVLLSIFCIINPIKIKKQISNNPLLNVFIGCILLSLLYFISLIVAFDASF